MQTINIVSGNPALRSTAGGNESRDPVAYSNQKAPSVLRSSSHVIPLYQVVYLPFFLGNLKYRTGTREGRVSNNTLRTGKDDKTLAWEIQLQLASWLSGRGITICSLPMPSGWKWNLRPCNLRPKDAPIFTACRHRDYHWVHQLLDDGEASPYDVDEFGYTPLHVGLVPTSGASDSFANDRSSLQVR